MENNIEIRNTCPSEAISINTKFENNEKSWNYEMQYKSPKTIQISTKESF
jgi:hypothetical protein